MHKRGGSKVGENKHEDMQGRQQTSGCNLCLFTQLFYSPHD